MLFLRMKSPRLRSQSFPVKSWDLKLCFRAHSRSVLLLLKTMNSLRCLIYIAKLLCESIGSMSNSWKFRMPQFSGKQTEMEIHIQEVYYSKSVLGSPLRIDSNAREGKGAGLGRGRSWALIIPVFYLFLIFVYFWPCSVFIASCGLSLVAASTGDTLYCVAWLSCCRAGTLGTRAQESWPQALERASVVVAVGPGAGSGVVAVGPGAGFQLWPQALERAQELGRMGLGTPWHVESSWTRGQAHVFCIVRWILNH